MAVCGKGRDWEEEGRKGGGTSQRSSFRVRGEEGERGFKRTLQTRWVGSVGVKLRRNSEPKFGDVLHSHVLRGELGQLMQTAETTEPVRNDDSHRNMEPEKTMKTHNFRRKTNPTNLPPKTPSVPHHQKLVTHYASKCAEWATHEKQVTFNRWFQVHIAKLLILRKHETMPRHTSSCHDPLARNSPNI